MYLICYYLLMSWSTRRKLLYLFAVLLVIFGLVSFFSYQAFKETPICTDGKQNGTELGVDCGGICTNLCTTQVHPASILWSRSFLVAPGLYDVLGYVENQNADAGVSDILYRFKFYDDKNVLIAERDGRTYLGPNQTTAIFEAGIRTGERIPKRVFLEFEDGYQWIKTDPRLEKISLGVNNKNLTDISIKPRLSAGIANNSLTDLKNVEVVAILRDSNDNAIAVSRTVINILPKQSSKDVFFTWLFPFSDTVSRTEIIPRINPFTIVY